MADLIEVRVGSGTLTFAAAGSSGPQAYTGAQIAAKASESLEEVLDRACALGETIAERFAGLSRFNAEVTFGLKVTAGGRFIVAEATGEASISVKLSIPPS